MGTRVNKSIAGISMILSAVATANSAATDFNSHDFEDCRRASENELNDMRGGFELNLGGMQLLLSLGIERVTYVNGVLVAMNSLNLVPNLNVGQLGQVLNSQISTSGTQQAPAASSTPALASTTQAGMPAPTPAPRTPNSIPIQSSPPATSPTVSSIPAATSASPVGNVTTAAPATPVAVVPVPISLPNTSAPNSFQPVQLAQVGQGNTFVLPNVTSLTSGIMTVVQNRLDNQIIQNMTIINATLANQNLIRSMAINAALSRISSSLSR